MPVQCFRCWPNGASKPNGFQQAGICSRDQRSAYASCMMIWHILWAHICSKLRLCGCRWSLSVCTLAARRCGQPARCLRAHRPQQRTARFLCLTATRLLPIIVYLDVEGLPRVLSAAIVPCSICRGLANVFVAQLAQKVLTAPLCVYATAFQMSRCKVTSYGMWMAYCAEQRRGWS